MIGQDAIKSIYLNIKKRFQKKLKHVKNLAGIKKTFKTNEKCWP